MFLFPNIFYLYPLYPSLLIIVNVCFYPQGIPGRRSAQDELLHHVQPEARLRGTDQGPRQPLRPGLLRWSYGK